MIGLAIISGLIVIVYFSTILDPTMVYGESQDDDEEKTLVHLINIPTPEQEVDEEELKEQWISNFNQLLKESNNVDNID